MHQPPRLLIAHANADAWCGELEMRFPGMRYTIARSADALATTDLSATVAYSCVTDDFPRTAHTALRHRPSIEWIHVGGSGFDHLAESTTSGPLLTNGAGVLAPYLAETLLGALIAMNRGFGRAARDQMATRWAPWSFAAIEGQTLAIVGIGAIGTAFAMRAKALGLRVVGVARRPMPQAPFDDILPLDHLGEVAGTCDYLSVNVRLVPETHHLIDTHVLAAMRPSAFLLNAARGAVVDETALVDALQQGRIAGAYLDVFATEPLSMSSPLWRLDTVLMTPHMSDRVVDWELRHARFFMANLKRWLAGKPLMNVVAG